MEAPNIHEASGGLPRPKLLQRLTSALPRGGSLPEDVWRRRQRAILALLWAHVPIVLIFGLVLRDGLEQTALAGGAVAAFAVLASLRNRSRKYTSTATALGLLSSSAALVDLSGGSIEMHFHFFVVIGVLSLYEDWLPFLLAVGFVLIHHAVAGLLIPDAVFNDPAAQANPLVWAGVHAFFVACAGLVFIAAWRLNEDVRMELATSSGQLAESEERFRNAFENAPIGMVLVGVDGSFLRVNRSFCRMLGRSEQSLLGHRFSDITHPDDRAESHERLLRLESGETKGYQMEKRYLHADGHAVWVMLSTSTIPAPDGSPLYFVGHIQDISERKHAEAQIHDSMELLHDSNEQRRQLLDRTVRVGEEERMRIASELHDGPIQHLAAIDIRLHGARVRLDRGEVEVSTRVLEQAQDHLRGEIGGLRRMMYELRPPALDARGLEAALGDYVDGIRRQTGMACGFECRLDSRPAPALETILYRVAQEALTNVVKHAKAGEVKLFVRTNETNIELEVSDNGVGFDLEEARAMAGKNHFGLVGMRERVASAGGTFDIHSQPGAGSRIHAILPRDVSAESQEAVPLSRAAGM